MRLNYIELMNSRSPFLRRDLPFVSKEAQPVFDWTQIQHMFWTIPLAKFGGHDQLVSKHFPKVIKSTLYVLFKGITYFHTQGDMLCKITSQKHAAYEHSGAEGTRSVISRSLLLLPKAAVKAPLDI